MARLHELLAVEGDLQGAFTKMMKETLAAWKKDHLFIGFTRTLRWFDDEKPKMAPERQNLSTTVPRRLLFQSDFAIRYFDALLQKESTNQTARADLEVDGEVIAVGVPATFLLGMESRLKALREVYDKIPTLPPGVKWVRDESLEADVWIRKHPEIGMKTEKTIKPFVLYDATDKHPAQVEKLSVDKNIGEYERQVEVGHMSPADKSQVLGRLDKLIRAVKKKRMEANAATVVEYTIGKTIFAYIHGAEVSSQF